MRDTIRNEEKYIWRERLTSEVSCFNADLSAFTLRLPRALTWTHEPPKVPGRYWWRWAKFQEHMCLYVRDGLIVEYPHKHLRSVAEIGGQWSDGPIQAPAEPEES